MEHTRKHVPTKLESDVAPTGITFIRIQKYFFSSKINHFKCFQGTTSVSKN